ncbi:MAG TPA: DegT/DnrJ/EryC1/StrS family aminotransferase, partial [Herpetosiphonaceae bacterium]|nr:DegT/DnrJ/EryC1/StrS family aminotransferase [Herpetosiphonaceae bacterium]
LTVANAGTYATFAANAVGAIPRYVDVDPRTATMDAGQLAGAITPRTRAIVPVHLYGRVADLAAILEVAAAHDLPVLEDCAQAHGARWRGRHVGNLGVAGCFSFYPTKNLGALGDGGAVITNDDALAARVLQLRTYGWGQKYYATLAGGTNSRLDEVQAAMLRVKLRHLDAQNSRRVAIAARYASGLAGLPVTPLAPAPEGEHVHHLYVVLVAADRRPALQAALRAAGIGSEVHYPMPDHRQPAWAEQYAGLRLPVTEALADSVLSLPCYPELADAEVDEVIAALRAALA